MEKETQLNSHSYTEVTLNYRIYRAQILDAKNIAAKANRHVCPMVEAGRSNDAYGKMFMNDLTGRGLTDFAKALGVGPFAVKSIAYMSSGKASIFKNILQGKFDDQKITNGFIHSLKNGIHTGIYVDGRFSQTGFDAFIWSFHPELKNVSFTNAWLYSEHADTLYLENTHLEKVREHNLTFKSTKKVGFGERLSMFEMESLLIGVLGQRLSDHPTAKRGILVRDIYDLYKYGFVPARVEEKLSRKNLL